MLKRFEQCTAVAACVGFLFVLSLRPSAGQTRVTDSSGEPIPEVVVRTFTPNQLELPPSEEQWTTLSLTGADGTFQKDPPTSGTLLVLSREGYATLALPAQKPLPNNVSLPAAAAISGRVVDSKGAPVADALVGPLRPMEDETEQVFLNENLFPPPAWTKTNASGRFRVDGLQRGPYNFLVQARGFAPEPAAWMTGNETTVTLSTTGTTWTGTLVGSRDGLPQPDILVEASWGPMKLYALTGPDGEFTFSNLPEQQWQFSTSPSPQIRAKPARVAESFDGPNGKEILLLHNQGLSVSGRVLDADTSAPIADLSLSLNALSERDALSTVTSRNGLFRFDNVDAFRQYSLRFDPDAYTYRSKLEGRWTDRVVVSTFEGQDLTDVRFALMPKVAVRGKVVDPQQEPVPGARVLFRSCGVVDQGADELSRAMLYQVETDKEGRFAASLFPPGCYEVRASAASLDSGTRIVEALTTSSDDLVLSALPLNRLHGLTTDSGGGILRGTRVELLTVADTADTSGLPSGRLLASTQANERGRFAFAGAFPARVRLMAIHPAFDESATTEIAVLSAEGSPIDLRFPPGRLFTVHVTNRDGMPIQSASVQVAVSSPGEEESSATRQLALYTGADGRAYFALNAARIESIAARHPDYARFEAGAVALPQQDYKIELRSNPSVLVKLVAPPGISEEKLSDNVWLLRARHADAEEEPLPGQFILVRQQQAEYGRALFSNVAPGWYRAALETAEAPFYAESDAVHITGDTTQKELEVTLGGGGSLSGRITDEETGEPVEGATVHVELQTGTPVNFEVISKPTDSQGRYRIAELPSATMVFTAKHPDYADKSQILKIPRSGVTRIDVKLGKAILLLTGQVTLDGKPLPEATIVIHSSPDMGKWLGSAVTDSNGRYTVQNMPEGNHTLVAEALWGPDQTQLRQTREIMIRGKDATADVSFRTPVRVTGRILISSADADPQQVHTLYFSSIKNPGDVQRAAPGADGNYEVHLEPGSYTVGLQDGPGLPLEVPKGIRGLVANFDYRELVEASEVQVPQQQ